MNFLPASIGWPGDINMRQTLRLNISAFVPASFGTFYPSLQSAVAFGMHDRGYLNMMPTSAWSLADDM
jgi:hypothetical protein